MEIEHESKFDIPLMCVPYVGVANSNKNINYGLMQSLEFMSDVW